MRLTRQILRSYKILSYTDEKTRQPRSFLFSAFLKDSYSEQNLKNLNIIEGKF